jgi:hypothetical protein
MSFQRLATVYHSAATAYPPSNQPISTRQVADESSSEESDSDNDSQYLLDHNAHILRRRNAQARARNRLQPAFDRINDGLQPVRHLANRVAGFFDEAGFQLHVVVLTIGRLLLGLFWFIVEALWWTVWSITFLIGEIVWRVLDLALRIVFAIPQTLRCIPRHNLEQIPAAMVLVLIVLSLRHGFVRMKSHICDDPGLVKEWAPLSGACTGTKTMKVLGLQNRELDRLVYANDDVLHSISNMAGTGNLNPHPGNGLLRETTALVEFAKAHNGSLASWSKRYDFVAVANEVHSNVTAFNTAVEKFVHHHKIQLDELEIKAQRILANAKGYKLHSPGRRFFLETIFFLFPGIFSRTGAALQSAHYVNVATRYLESPQNTAITQHSNTYSLHMYNIKQGLITAREALVRYEPYWKIHCQQHGEAESSEHKDCGEIDPSNLKERLARALHETDVSEKRLNQMNGFHNTVREGLYVLRTDLRCLLKTAVWYHFATTDDTVADDKASTGKKAAAGKKRASNNNAAAGNNTPTGNNTVAVETAVKLNAASSRAVLHRFVVEVGLVDLFIGYGTFELGMAFDDGVTRGSRRYKRLADGRAVPHLEQYRNQAQSDGSWFWGPWW